MQAILVEAVAPWNRGSREERVAVVAGREVVRAQMRVDRESWPVRGMLVDLDGDRVGAIAPLSERIAAGDPTLLDPIAAVRAARAALEDAQEMDPEVADVVRLAREKLREVDEQERDAKLLAAEEEYSSGPAAAPDGRLRGYARMVSRSKPRPSPDPGGGADTSPLHTIYAVQLIGQAAYATVKADDRTDRRMHGERFDIEGGGIVPVLVDPRDRDALTIEWDRVPDLADQRRQAALDEGDRVARHTAAVAPEMLAMQFAALPDPAMRATLAAQLRAQGMTVPEELVTGSDERRTKLDRLLAKGFLTQAEYDEQIAKLEG